MLLMLPLKLMHLLALFVDKILVLCVLECTAVRLLVSLSLPPVTEGGESYLSSWWFLQHFTYRWPKRPRSCHNSDIFGQIILVFSKVFGGEIIYTKFKLFCEAFCHWGSDNGDNIILSTSSFSLQVHKINSQSLEK